MKPDEPSGLGQPPPFTKAVSDWMGPRELENRLTKIESKLAVVLWGAGIVITAGAIFVSNIIGLLPLP